MVEFKTHHEPQMDETAVQQTLPTTTVEEFKSGRQPQLDDLHNGREPEMVELKTEHEPRLDDLHESLRWWNLRLITNRSSMKRLFS